MTKTLIAFAGAAILTSFLAVSANAMDLDLDVKPVCSEDGCTLGLDVGPAVLVAADE